MSEAEDKQIVFVRPDMRTVMLVTGGILVLVAAAATFTAAGQVFGWLLATAVFAVLIHPIVTLLDRFLPRVIAIVVTILTLAAVVATVIYGAFVDLRDDVDRLVHESPRIALEIESRDDRIGTVARRIDLVEQVDVIAESLDERVATRGELARIAVLAVPAFLVSGILSIFLVIYGPGYVESLLRLIPNEDRREHARRATYLATRNARSYIGAAIVQGGVIGLLAALVASQLGLPVPFIFGVVAGLIATIPYVGIVLGWLPVLVLGLGVASPLTVAGIGCALLVAQAVEGVVWRRWFDVRTVHVGPLLPFVAAVLGYSVYGEGGAFYSVILLIFGLALLDAHAEVGGDDEELPMPLDDWPARSSFPS